VTQSYPIGVVLALHWRVLWPLAHVHAHDGEIAEALRAARGLLGLARTFGDEPLWGAQHYRSYFRDQAVRLVERALAHGTAPNADLIKLQDTLAWEAEYDIARIVVGGERAMAHELFLQAEQGLMPFDRFMQLMSRQDSSRSVAAEYDEGGPWETSLVARLQLDHEALLRATTRMLAIARRPPHEQSLALRALEAEVKTGPPLTRITVTRLSNWFAAEQVALARLRSLVVAVGVERYRLDRGRWPDALVEVPGLSNYVSVDPYGGQRLRYRRTDNGVVVYAVGPDGIDDGGKLSAESPPPVGTDVGCTLPDVDQRPRPNPPPSHEKPK